MFQIKEEICMRLKCNISHSIGQIYSKKIGLYKKANFIFYFGVDFKLLSKME